MPRHPDINITAIGTTTLTDRHRIRDIDSTSERCELVASARRVSGATPATAQSIPAGAMFALARHPARQFVTMAV
jgi:hypothetical protein